MAWSGRSLSSSPRRGFSADVWTGQGCPPRSRPAPGPLGQGPHATRRISRRWVPTPDPGAGRPRLHTAARRSLTSAGAATAGAGARSEPHSVCPRQPDRDPGWSTRQSSPLLAHRASYAAACSCCSFLSPNSGRATVRRCIGCPGSYKLLLLRRSISRRNWSILRQRQDSVNKSSKIRRRDKGEGNRPRLRLRARAPPCFGD
jgi:hypothetical protein